MNKISLNYKFSGHLNSNLFIRTSAKTNVTHIWSSQIVPIVNQQFSDAGVQVIKGAQTWDEWLRHLLKIGAVYLDQKRMTMPFEMDSHQVVRFHLMPRRFDTTLFRFDRDVIFQNQDFLIVNKPALLPVHPTLDNLSENIVSLLQTQMQQEMYTVHRLDLETTGLMVFAKNETARTYFQNLFSAREIKKMYRAVVGKGEIPLGFKQHWMEKNPRSPKRISSVAQDNYINVELIILKQEVFSKIPDSSIVDIELLTGKTHQIRSQLAHLGFPLLGDSLYRGAAFADNQYDHFLLHAFRLQFSDPQGQVRVFELEPNW